MNFKMHPPVRESGNARAARNGVRHFMGQRVSAVLLVPLSVWFMTLLVELRHADYVGARLIFSHSLNAVAAIAFAIVTFWHARLGLQVIVEDYIHDVRLEGALQILVNVVCSLGFLINLFAIAHVAWGA